MIEQMEFLIGQSLVKRMRSDEMAPKDNLESRFHLLETIREYALEQLARAGEQADVQRQHASYYLSLVEKTEASLSGDDSAAAVALFVREQGNLRAALAWATDHGENDTALRISCALGRFWEARMQFHEAFRWIDAVFKLQADTPLSARANLLMGAARLALWEIGCERSRELAQEALTLYAAEGNQVGRTWALFHIGDTWHIQGDYVLSSTYLEQCLQLLHAQQDWRNYAFTLSRLGALATLRGQMQKARAWLSEARELLYEYDEPGLQTVTLVYLGILTFVQGELVLSSNYLREGMLLARQTGNHYMLAADLLVLGCALGRMYGPFYTAHICSAAEMLYASLKASVPTAYRPLYDTNLGSLQAKVDRVTWDMWWEEGKAFSLEEICTLALSAERSQRSRSTDALPRALIARRGQVAATSAAGTGHCNIMVLSFVPCA
ncbi:hypothetical protein KDW_48980 [Dictyobacter vulcani]|uniref:Uncharacterized protein n=1 Tax=Dictyobacter vulcani TaxID=2607529 RepID=A0A5J4KZS6_9CHLR|nr:hypothetical protein KDW_48980 [Dictyobacter vulcani]